MGREIEVAGPSGFAGVARGLQGREVDMFAHVEEAKKNPVMDRVLAACWVRTTDAGPYRDPNPAWPEMLNGDRFAAVFAIRTATHGDLFEFDCLCPNRACKSRKFVWGVKLSEIPVQRYPAEALEAFRAGNRLEAQIGGRTYVYKLTVGEAKVRNDDPSKRVTESLRARLVEIEGVDTNDMRAHIQGMEWGDQLDLVAAMDANEGGPETDVDITCPACETEQTIVLPFDRASFWTPKRRKPSRS